ncbi:MAG: hypothetical protein ABR572_04085 [Cryomorphaceae bacterium]
MAVNVNGDPGHSSSIFDVSSTDKGVLLPRMTAAQRNAINSPADGLLVYQHNGEAGFYVFSNGSWKPLSGASSTAPDLPALPETVTVYSTDFYATNTGWGIIPGMNATVTVPAGETASISLIADVGLVTNGTGNNNRSCTDLALIRDGALLPEGGYKRVTAGTGTESNHNNHVQNPVITGNEILGPGTYTFSLAAVQTCSGGQSRNAVLAGDAGSILQGSLSVSLIFQ